MKNEITYQIPQHKIREFLNLDNQKFQELKKQVGISTLEPLTYNNLKTLISFSSRLDKNVPEINKFDLKLFEVDTNDLIQQSIIRDIPEPKKIKIYKEKKSRISKSKKEIAKLEILNYQEKMKIFKTHEEAAKAYRDENKNIYWAINTFTIDNKHKFDDSGSFSFNFNNIKKIYPKGKIFLFTDNTVYEKVVINSRRKIVFTSKCDEKILDYYNSDFYKYHKTIDGKPPYTMKDLCRDLKVKDRKIIAQRASELGFTNFVAPKVGNEYCDEELEILKANVGKINTKKIQQLLKEKGYQKSIVSINVKLTRLSLSLKLDGTNDLTLTLLSKALGIDTHVITDNKNLILQVKPEKTNKELIFTREKLREYIIQNPYDLNFGKVDNKFLVGLLVGDKNANS